MSNFNMSQFFPGSAKITSKGSLLVENQKYSDDFNPRYVTPTSNRFNIQNSLVLPSIDKNVSHKKLNTPDMLASKSAKAGDGLNVKEALKDWLVGKSDVNIEDIFKQRFQQVKLSDKNNMSSKVIKTEDNSNSPAQPLIPIKKRRTLLRSQRYSQDIYETNSQSTLDSSYNKNIFEYQQPPMGGSAQTIQLPRVLELANEQNQQNSEVIRKSNSGQIRPTRKVSIDIFDEPSSSTTQPNEQQQSNTFEPKRISSQQVINYGNSLSNQRQSENIYTPSTQSKRSSFLDGSNNMTSNGGSNNNLPAPPSLFFSYRYGKNTNSPNESRGHTPVKYGSESKIPSSIFSQQSTTPNLSSFQNLDMISSLSNKKKESTSIFSINSSEFPSRQEIRSRRLQNKPIASSMGNIVLPDSLKQQLTKSILKDRSTNKERTLPPILKKSVIFSEKVEAFPI